MEVKRYIWTSKNAARLRAYRAFHNLSMVELARQLGVSDSTIHRLEQHWPVSVNPTTYERIKSVLNIEGIVQGGSNEPDCDLCRGIGFVRCVCTPPKFIKFIVTEEGKE